MSFLSQFRVGGTFPARRKTAPPPIALEAPRRCAVRCVSPLPPRLPAGLAPQWQRASRCNPRPPARSAAEAVSAPVKHRQSPGPVGDVGGSHMYRMGQSLRVHRETLDSRHLLACVSPCAQRSGSPRYRSWSALSDHCFVGPRQPIFFRLVPEWNPDLGQAARSIAGNTCNKCANRGKHSPLAPAFQEVQYAAENVKSTVRGLVRRRADSNVGRIRANCSRLMSLGG